MIIAVNFFPMKAIGKKKPEKNQGFKNELFHIVHIISLLTGDMNSIN